MDTSKVSPPSAHSIARAIRSSLSNGKSSLETSTLYSALSNPEIMNGLGNLSESVWNELSVLSVPESTSSFNPLSLSIEIQSGKVSPLKPQWKEIKANPSAVSGTMRRWPSLSPSLHLVSTWFGYSLYVPTSALAILEMEKASRGEDSRTRFTPSGEALSKLDGFPPGALNGLATKISKEASKLKSVATGLDQETQSVGVIISATWLAPHALCSRPWTSFEESLPMTSTSKEVPTSSSSVYAFPSQDGDALKESSILSHHRRNSTPISAVSMNRPLPATPPITPSPSERKNQRSFFGLVRRPSTPSSPSISRNVSFKATQVQEPTNNELSTDATGSDPNTADPNSGSTNTPSSSAAPESATSTSTSNAGTGVAVAIGPHSASAATATHGPTFSLTQETSEDQNQDQNANANANINAANGTKGVNQKVNGGGNIQVSGSFALLKFGFGGGNRRAREVEQRAAYEREQAAKREEKLALMLAASRVAVAGGGVAVAVKGSSASASFSASAAGDSAEAEAEQGQTAGDDSQGNVTSGSNSTTKSTSSKAIEKKLHSSKGQIQSQFIKEDDEEEEEEEEEDGNGKIAHAKDSDKGRSITRTTVTTVTTTDVERIPSSKSKADLSNDASQPTVTVSAT